MMKRMNDNDGHSVDDKIEELRVLDPSLNDESYWDRFRFRVMTRAADELHLRRVAPDGSVVGVVERWSRMLAPIAAAAAVIAGFLILSDAAATSQPVDLEEMLMAEVESLPPAEADEFSPTGVRFASEAF